MISTRIISVFAVICLAATGTAAMAEDQTLGFRLIIHTIESTVFETPVQEGHVIGVDNAKGSAVFDDGRLADKTFVDSYDINNGVGTFTGYSVYSFVDGSSISASFEATLNADGVIGVYTVLGGTGAYEGAQGTGSFASVEAPWEGASLFDGEFKLVLP